MADETFVTFFGTVVGEEKAFYEALMSQGMEPGSYAVAAAMRAFRSWCEQRPKS